MTAADSLVKTIEKKVTPKGMPSWVVPVGAVLFVLIFAWAIQPSTFAPAANNNVVAPPAANNTVLPPVVAPLPDKVTDVSVSPLAPLAGNDITITAVIRPEYLFDWEQKFSFELWVRQFGNWQKTSCFESPCTFVLKAASLGTVEYKVVRTAEDGTITDEGSTYVEVASTVQTGDTKGPTVTVSHSPQNPKAGQSVTIAALINDYSPLERVDIYNGGEIIKTCPQKVKIMTCQAVISNAPVGASEYYVIAIDSYGNTTQTTAQSYSVALN